MGVIGAGAWGKNHVRTAATLPEAELVAVCDADPKTRQLISRQYPAVHVTADVADLLSRVDAVVIASPATTHARVALQCVEAGKPCLVEKPFALSTRDAEAVARAAAERKVPVLAGHLLVFPPAVERLRALVQGGAEEGRVRRYGGAGEAPDLRQGGGAAARVRVVRGGAVDSGGGHLHPQDSQRGAARGGGRALHPRGAGHGAAPRERGGWRAGG